MPYMGKRVLHRQVKQQTTHLIGAVCMGMVVRVPLQPEDDGVGEQPVAVPGVLFRCPFYTADNSLD